MSNTALKLLQCRNPTSPKAESALTLESGVSRGQHYTDTSPTMGDAIVIQCMLPVLPPIRFINVGCQVSQRCWHGVGYRKFEINLLRTLFSPPCVFASLCKLSIQYNEGLSSSSSSITISNFRDCMRITIILLGGDSETYTKQSTVAIKGGEWQERVTREGVGMWDVG